MLHSGNLLIFVYFLVKLANFIFRRFILFKERSSVLKVTLQTNQLSCKASARDLKFLDSIRDKNVAVFDSLQKQKIETLLKYREVQKVIENYHDLLNNYSNSGVAAEIIMKAKSDLEDMKVFKDTLWNKLREINFAILAEEEKNY